MLNLFLVALAACCLMGGSSKATAPRYLLLWPVLAMVLSTQLYRYDLRGLVRHSRIFWLLTAQTVAIASGLILLPPAIWLALPGHDRYAAAVGSDTAWRWLSLTPDQTINSLLMVIPPLIAIIAIGRIESRRIVQAIVVAGIASALLGLAQIASGAGLIGFSYRDYDHDLPIGWFPNRNHQATFLAGILPLLTLIYVRRDSFAGRRWRSSTVAATTMVIGMVLAGVILATGSRSGLIQLGIAIAGGAIVVATGRSGGSALSKRQRWVALATIVGVVTVAALLLTRSAALHRLQTFRAMDDERFRNLHAVKQAISTFFPIGTGYGSFDPVFRGFEQDGALNRTYFNNAHNDLLETLLTGGFIGTLVLVAFLLWLVAIVAGNVRQAIRTKRADAAFIATSTSILIVLIASLTDYPLRTPLMGFVFASYCALLDQIGNRRRHPASKSQEGWQATDDDLSSAQSFQ